MLRAEKFLNFCVVGGGPAGLYTSRLLLKKISNCQVDLFEKLPVPFGLIRYGVAPDHMSIKRSIYELSQIAKDDRFRFAGNVEIGKDIRVKELEKHYSAIIFAYGAEEDRKMNILGEDSCPDVISAREIVNWYNSHPASSPPKFDLSKKKTMVIIGNGNVAIDIARILTKPKTELSKTDISLDALEKISNSKIENIVLVGRRGIIQSAFSLKEMREFKKLGHHFFLVLNDLNHSLNKESLDEIKDIGKFYGQVTRANKRKFEFLREFDVIEDEEHFKELLNTKHDKIKVFFRYLLNPVKMNLHNEAQLESVDFQQNKLSGPAFSQYPENIKNSELINIPCDLLVRSIGYKSKNIDEDLNFDNQSGVLRNSNGCVIDKVDASKIEPGKYVVGWLKTGPKGIIDSTMKDCEETVINMMNHIENGMLDNKPYNYQEIIDTISKKRNSPIFDFSDWQKIDNEEIELGKPLGKPRLKLLNFNKFK